MADPSAKNSGFGDHLKRYIPGIPFQYPFHGLGGPGILLPDIPLFPGTRQRVAAEGDNDPAGRSRWKPGYVLSCHFSDVHAARSSVIELSSILRKSSHRQGEFAARPAGMKKELGISG